MSWPQLKETIDRRGISRRHLSEISGVDQGTLIQYLRPGRTANPSMAIIRKLAKALRVTPGSLIDDPAERKAEGAGGTYLRAKQYIMTHRETWLPAEREELIKLLQKRGRI